MTLGRFAAPIDWRSVAHHLAGLLQLLGVLLVLPVLVAVLAGEHAYAVLFAGIALAVVAVGWLVRRFRPAGLGLREALVVTVLAYPLLTLVTAGVYLPDHSPVDAVFETLSGFTTTGLTVVEEETLPASVAFFRSFSQWLGGAGIAIVYMAVLAGPGSATSRLYLAEFDEDNVLGNVVRTARGVAAVYLGLTLAGYLALVAAGAGLFDGLLHALSLLSTGGFSPFATSVGAYDSTAVASVTSVFMVAGATSLPLLYVLVAQRRWRRFVGDVQLRTMLALIVVGTVAVLPFHGLALRDFGAHLFHAISALTTTGFTLDDPAQWPAGAKIATVGLMFVGGSSASTAGGLKLLRLALLARLVWWSLVRPLLPREATVPLQVQDVRVREDELRRVVAVAACYAVLLFASWLLLLGTDAAPVDALFEAASALGTVGQSAGLTAPELATGGKLVLCLNMWLGRVEVFAVLFLFPLGVTSHPRSP